MCDLDHGGPNPGSHHVQEKTQTSSGYGIWRAMDTEQPPQYFSKDQDRHVSFAASHQVYSYLAPGCEEHPSGGKGVTSTHPFVDIREDEWVFAVSELDDGVRDSPGEGQSAVLGSLKGNVVEANGVRASPSEGQSAIDSSLHSKVVNAMGNTSLDSRVDARMNLSSFCLNADAPVFTPQHNQSRSLEG